MTTTTHAAELQAQCADTADRLRNIFESTFNQLDGEQLDADVVNGMRTDLRDAKDEVGELVNELFKLYDTMLRDSLTTRR